MCGLISFWFPSPSVASRRFGSLIWWFVIVPSRRLQPSGPESSVTSIVWLWLQATNGPTCGLATHAFFRLKHFWSAYSRIARFCRPRSSISCDEADFTIWSYDHAILRKSGFRSRILYHIKINCWSWRESPMTIYSRNIDCLPNLDTAKTSQRR